MKPARKLRAGQVQRVQRVQRPARSPEIDKHAGAAPADPPFPIVGIGTSAGGLEALSAFLQHVPEGSRSAFIVLQHLDPTHKGMLPELLQRATRLPVVPAADRMTIEPGRVYVTPANTDISLLHGTLHLLPISPRRSRRS
jgi:two-component system CheB/CheR fusion protein